MTQCPKDERSEFKPEDWTGFYKHMIDIETDFDIYYSEAMIVLVSGLHKDHAILIKSRSNGSFHEYWRCVDLSFSYGVWTAKTQSFGHRFTLSTQCEYLEKTALPILPDFDFDVVSQDVHVNVQMI